MEIINILLENGYKIEESYICNSTLYGECYYKCVNDDINVVVKKCLNIYSIEFYYDGKYEYLYFYDNQTLSSMKEPIDDYHLTLKRDSEIKKIIQNDRK